MKIVVVGTGGVGGYFGGRLLEHGEDVSFVATPRSVAVLKDRGLIVRSVNGDLDLVDLKVSAGYEEVVDLVVLAMKSQHLEGALEGIENALGEHTVILPLLNGVYATRYLSERFGGRVLGGFCRVISFKEDVGVIRHLGSGVVELGELEGPVSDRVRGVAEVFRGAGVDVRLHDDFLTAQWEKLVLIATLGVIGSVTRATFGEMLAIDEVRLLIRTAFLEAIAVARSQGAAVDDGLADRYLEWVGKLPVEGTTSTQRDVVAGIPSEVDYLAGDLVRLGADLDIPTLRTLYYSVLPQEHRHRSLR